MRAAASLSLTDAELVSRQTPGWMIPTLINADTMSLHAPADIAAPGKPKGVTFDYQGHGRWDWWLSACYCEAVPLTPIPQLNFENEPDPNDAKEIRDILRPVVAAGLGGYDDAWVLLVRWLLHSFNYQPVEMEVERIPERIRAEWYASFNIYNLLHTPCDWSAYVLQHNLPGDKPTASSYTGSGFFSTPMSLCKMMTAMNFSGTPRHEHKFESVLDPAAGTGSMLLPASNYSLRLFGQDIVYNLCLCAILNGYLWAPWLVFMPESMREVLEAGAADRREVPLGVNYTTSPEVIAQVEAMRNAAREGALVQLEML